MLTISCSTRVVVLGAFHHSGVAITRSLGRLGVRVYIVDSKKVPATVSRYCSGFFLWDVKSAPAEDSVRFLLDLARTLGEKPILIPTTDFAALLVLDHESKLRSSFLFPNQLAQTSHALVSKRSMGELAVGAGIPTPATFAPQSTSELLTYAEDAQFPLMLKADDCGTAPARNTKTKSIVHDRQQLLHEYNAMQDPGRPNLIIQEYIPGGEDSIWMFNGYFDHNSDCLFGMTGKKIRQNPVYTGASCLAICIQNETVRDLTLCFMKSIRYRGILDIGYRYDARDGKYKVLDVNPRIGATFRLFTGTNDMDVARALYLDLTGQTVPHSPPAADGRKWIAEDADLVSSYRYFRDGKLTFKDWIESLKGIHEFSFLSLTDPLPIVSALAIDIRDLISRICSATGSAIRRNLPLAMTPDRCK